MSKNSRFSFQDYSFAFFEHEAPPLTIKKVVALKCFVKHLKHRLSTIVETWADDGCCAKLVTSSGYSGRFKTYRCGGSLESYGCANCDHTGIECAGQCGGCVMRAGDFCSRSCYGEYHKDGYRGESD